MKKISLCPTAFVALLSLSACHRADHPHVDGTVHTDEILKRWQSADLKTDDFREVDPGPYSAAHCDEGHVSGLSATLCEYKDDDSLDQAQRRLEAQWAKAGHETAVGARQGRTFLAVVDAQHADPNGRTINTLVTRFKKP
jgi:hypothetical protein